MSSNEDGVKMVRLAAAEIENLCPQVIVIRVTFCSRNRQYVCYHRKPILKYNILKFCFVLCVR
jgi:catenin alpha